MKKEREKEKEKKKQAHYFDVKQITTGDRSPSLISSFVVSRTVSKQTLCFLSKNKICVSVRGRSYPTVHTAFVVIMLTAKGK